MRESLEQCQSYVLNLLCCDLKLWNGRFPREKADTFGCISKHIESNDIKKTDRLRKLFKMGKLFLLERNIRALISISKM